MSTNPCVDAIEGFPYMLQLVGYRAWIEAGERDEIAARDARRAAAGALREMEDHVVGATMRELSDGDMRFLRAMLEDPSTSRISAIAERMGVGSNYATKYRTRLLAQGVIDEVARGKVEFAILGVREYLSSHPE